MPQNKVHRRILVIKHGALGDIVQALDAFASLRAGNPHAHITLMTSPVFLSLAKMMPWFDQVIGDPRAGLLNLAAAWRIRQYFRQDWSVIVDMQCSSRTRNYFAHFVLSNRRWIGTAPGCSDPLPDFTGVNNRDRMVKSAEMAGGISQTPDISWLVKGAEQTEDPAVMINGKQYAVLVPGCSLAKPQKRWPANRFAAIGNELVSRGFEIVLVGTDDDREAVNAVLAASPDAINLCGKTNLVRLARLLGGAAFVIGNDSGPMFLAARTGVPSLMIMGPDTDPTMSAPKGAEAIWLQGAPISEVSAAAAIIALESLGLKPNA
jgi:ADP-heptose:LPS heptosyltransferase